MKQIRELVPQVSLADFEAIVEIATAGHLRHLPPSIAAWQAVTSRARHAHTSYDELLEEGYEPESARYFVLDDINECLSRWGCSRRVTGEEERS